MKHVKEMKFHLNENIHVIAEIMFDLLLTTTTIAIGGYTIILELSYVSIYNALFY